MIDRPDSPLGTRTALVIGLFLLISVGAMAPLWNRAPAASLGWVPTPPDWVFYPMCAVLVGGLAIGVTHAAVVKMGKARQPDLERRLRRRRGVLFASALLGAFLVFYLALGLVLSFVDFAEETEAQPGSEAAAEIAEVEESTEDLELATTGGPGLSDEGERAVSRERVVMLAVTVVSLAAAVVLACVVVRRIRGEASQAENREHARLRRDLLDAARGMTRRIGEAVDPRQAVIEAYALLEAALARHGAPRPSYRTPREYLVGYLADDPVGIGTEGVEAFAALARLYEVARFSTHEVTEADRGRALSILENIETRLERG